MNNIKGMSLIEIACFLVIVGFITSGVMQGIYSALKRSPETEAQALALELAKGRMEIIIGQKAISGFNSFTDICVGGTPPAICNTNTDYTISSTITTGYEGDNNYKVITVNVTGNGTASTTSVVGNYT